MRLDKQLKADHPELSWRQVRDAVEKGQVTVDGRVENDPGLDVYGGAAIELNLNRPAQSRARASFDILHEDDTIIVLNKPAGLLSIPSNPDAGSSEDTVLRRVREYRQFKLGHKSYVGMLHRLDRDTSASLAVALSKDAHAAGREMFKEHRFERHYLALVQGIPEKSEGTIDARISSGYRDGRRILVERLWPRGLTKQKAQLDEWDKQIAPTTELRKWYDHDIPRWKEFQRRYKDELKQMPDRIKALREAGKGHTVTLIYAARDEEHNGAVVLKDFLEHS